MNKSLALSFFAVALSSTAVAAESQLSVYGGYQSSPHSVITGEYDNDPFDFTAGWDTKPFEMPPYYGFRYTFWSASDWGLSLDYVHSKVYSDDETRADTGFEVLEFTDGINVLTANAVRRFPNAGKWTPYVGAGLGFTFPHVEVQVNDAAVKTYETQIGGPAAQFHTGVEYSISENWAVFTEYKINYVMLDVDLDGPGDNNFLQTDIITNAINVGVSYTF